MTENPVHVLPIGHVAHVGVKFTPPSFFVLFPGCEECGRTCRNTSRCADGQFPIIRVGSQVASSGKIKSRIMPTTMAIMKGVTPLYTSHTDSLRDTRHDKNRYRNRRNDDPYHQCYTDDYSEPDRIKPKLYDCRVKNGGCEDHESHILDERPSQEVNENNQNKDHKAVHVKTENEVRHHHGYFRKLYQVAEHGGTGDNV